MGKRLTVAETAKATNLSEYAIRLGIKQRRYPHIRTSGGKGRILIDIEMFEDALRKEAERNMSGFNAQDQEGTLLNYGQLRRI